MIDVLRTIPTVRRTGFRLLLLLLFLCLFSLPALSETRLETYRIMDRQGFDRPVPAFTISVPGGWQSSGQVLWNKPCSDDEFYAVLFRTVSPDGTQGLRIRPGHQIIWTEIYSNTGDPTMDSMAIAQNEAALNKARTQFRKSNCHVGRVTGTRQLADRLILRHRPKDAEILSIKVLTDLKATLRQTVANNGMAGLGIDTYFDAVRVRLRYNSKTGMVDEDVDLVWVMDVMTLDIPPPMASRTVQQFATVFPTNSVWAPAGKLDAATPLFNAMKQSYRSVPDWQRQVTKLRREVQRERQKAHDESMKRQSELRDKQHEEFIEMIRGEDDDDDEDEKKKKKERY
ncbi:MAG: hypothetical protein NXI27_21390 [Alphaproteobacteria bacterium]|nr:hypothetical protein [Alphaproteobacteria bacterium]